MTAVFSTHEAVSLERKIDCDENHVDTHKTFWTLNELSRCTGWITSGGYKRVCLQFPDSYLPQSTSIAEQLRAATDAEIFILADTSYGACCVDEAPRFYQFVGSSPFSRSIRFQIAAEHAQADGMIHFGHACLAKSTRLPILYVLPKYPVVVSTFVAAFKDTLTDLSAPLSLFYDVGYYHAVAEITSALSEYTQLTIGQLALDNVEPDILCWSLKNVESVETGTCVYLGAENQSFLNLAMAIKCSNWRVFDPQSNPPGLNVVAPLDTRWLRRRMVAVEKCRDAQSIGIVVGTLTAQGYLDIVERIKALAKQSEIRTYLLSVGKVNPAKLANFSEIDCFVLVGCPENVVYTSRDYYKPLISVFELEMALNPAWRHQFPDTYCTDFRELLPQGRLFRDANGAADDDDGNNDMSLVTGRVRVRNSQKMDLDPAALAVAEPAKNELAISAADTFGDRSWRGLQPELGQHEPAAVQPGRTGIAMRYENDPKMEI